MSEEKKGVIRSRLAGVDYDLYFTETRIVAAKTGSVTGWAVMFGALGQGIAMYLSKKRSAQLRELTIESILGSDKKNFVVAYEEITRVELKKPKALSVGKLTINSGEKVRKFLLMEKKQFDSDMDVVTKCLPDKLEIT